MSKPAYFGFMCLAPISEFIATKDSIILPIAPNTLQFSFLFPILARTEENLEKLKFKFKQFFGLIVNFIDAEIPSKAYFILFRWDTEKLAFVCEINIIKTRSGIALDIALRAIDEFLKPLEEIYEEVKEELKKKGEVFYEGRAKPKEILKIRDKFLNEYVR